MKVGLFPNRRSCQPGIIRVRTRWRDAADVAAGLDAEQPAATDLAELASRTAGYQWRQNALP